LSNGGDEHTTERLEKQRIELMAVVTEIRKDGKEIKTIVTTSQIEIVEVKGKIELNAAEIMHNRIDIGKQETRIDKLNGRLNGLAVKVAGAASAAGAIAGSISSFLRGGG